MIAVLQVFGHTLTLRFEHETEEDGPTRPVGEGSAEIAGSEEPAEFRIGFGGS